jgi:Prokaryotic E2 family E
MTTLDELRRHAAELTEAFGYEVELVEGGIQIPVIMKAVALPEGTFAMGQTDILFLADAQYPVSALDMFWTDVDVLRADGTVPSNAEVVENYAGRTWRRFSWHRNGAWNPASNGLIDHFLFTLARLQMEVPAT